MCATVSHTSDRAPGCRKLCRQTFWTAVSFADVLEIFFLTYSEFLWPDSSNNTSFSSLCLSLAKQSSFKDAKMIHEELFVGARKRQKPLGSFFVALYSSCLAQDIRWEPKQFYQFLCLKLSYYLIFLRSTSTFLSWKRGVHSCLYSRYFSTVNKRNNFLC